MSPSAINSSAPLIELDNVKVLYGSRAAVDGLSFSLSAGESMGLLGVNGAGKTSTISAVLGMLPLRSGVVKLFGEKPGPTRLFQRLGFAPEDATPPEFLTGPEYLGFVGSLRLRKRSGVKQEVDDLISWFELDPRKSIRQYSKGMKRRLILAQAFLGKPDLLILDEPLNGLDPLIIIKLRDRIERYRAEGGTVLYSSHILNEVERNCSKVLILNSGKIALAENVKSAVEKYGSIEGAFAAVMAPIPGAKLDA